MRFRRESDMPVIRSDAERGNDMPDVLEREIKTYEREKDELLGRAAGKFVLIHDEEIVGEYESQADAIGEGYRRFGNVPFLVKRIEEFETPINFLSGRVAI
jgi:hypothetical protein